MQGEDVPVPGIQNDMEPRTNVAPFVNTPIELVTEILLFGCGDYFDADNPFAEDKQLRAVFIKRRSAFRTVAAAWRAVVDCTSAFWASHVLAPKQTRLAFDFLTARMSSKALNLRLILRGPAVCIPPARSDEIGISDIVKLLQTKSDCCATLGIYSEDRPLFAKITKELASHRFPRLTRLGLINIEPVWRADTCVRFQPVPDFLAGDGVSIRHVRLVGFALSFRDTGRFRYMTILVLDDLDYMAAPSMNELYGLLRTATAIEALSLGSLYQTDPVTASEPLILNRLKRLHFYTAGNSATEGLLRLLRAPGLIRLDVKLMCDRDWFALQKCEALVRPVVDLRVYGSWKPDLDFTAMSGIMPDVKQLDVTTADRALARCAVMEGFRWTKVETLLLRNPRFESLKTILTIVEVSRLHIHYPYPSKHLTYGGRQWVLTKVSDIIMTEDWTPLWYATAA